MKEIFNHTFIAERICDEIVKAVPGTKIIKYNIVVRHSPWYSGEPDQPVVKIDRTYIHVFEEKVYPIVQEIVARNEELLEAEKEFTIEMHFIEKEEEKMYKCPNCKKELISLNADIYGCSRCHGVFYYKK